MKRMLQWLACAAISMLAATGAPAADWKPSGTVRLIVPVQGGTVDVLARLVAPKLEDALGQPVVVENKVGAGGNLGTDHVAKSAPDGLTLLVGFTAPITVNVTLFHDLPYDPQKDLVPITLAVTTPQFLTVNPSLPVKTVDEFVRYAKERPGKLNYASIAVGSASHLTMEMFKAAAGLDIVHVPYKGSAPAVTDLIAGQTHLLIDVGSVLTPQVKGGKLRALAVTSIERSSVLPDVPTMEEAGVKGYDAVSWQMLIAPAATPKAAADLLNEKVNAIIQMPDVKAKIAQLGVTPGGKGNVAELEKFLRSEETRWSDVIKKAGLAGSI